MKTGLFHRFFAPSRRTETLDDEPALGSLAKIHSPDELALTVYAHVRPRFLSNPNCLCSRS